MDTHARACVYADRRITRSFARGVIVPLQNGTIGEGEKEKEREREREKKESRTVTGTV